MGNAEQRQVRTGVADRVRREQERTDHAAGLLGEVRRKREEATAQRRRSVGADKGLRAAVGIAALDPDPPADVDIAAAAGWQPDDVAILRAELLGRAGRGERGR